MFTYRYTGQPFAASAFVSGGGQQCYPLYDDLTGSVYENCVDIFIPGSGSSGYTTDNRVSFQFSTSRPLPPDATYVMNDLSGTANPTLLSWSVSDGTNSFDSTTGLNETATSAEGLLEPARSRPITPVVLYRGSSTFNKSPAYFLRAVQPISWGYRYYPVAALLASLPLVSVANMPARKTRSLLRMVTFFFLEQR